MPTPNPHPMDCATRHTLNVALAEIEPLAGLDKAGAAKLKAKFDYETNIAQWVDRYTQALRYQIAVRLDRHELSLVAFPRGVAKPTFIA